MKNGQYLMAIVIWMLSIMFLRAQNDQFELVGRWSYGVQTEIELRDDTAYISSGALLVKANVENVFDISELAQLDLGHFIRDFVMVDEFIYAITGDSLFTVDVSGGNMHILQTSPINAGYGDVFYANDLLFICAWERMNIYDITNRENPTFVSRIDTEDLQFRNLGFKGQYVYVQHQR